MYEAAILQMTTEIRGSNGVSMPSALQAHAARSRHQGRTGWTERVSVQWAAKHSGLQGHGRAAGHSLSPRTPRKPSELLSHHAPWPTILVFNWLCASLGSKL